VVRRDTFHANVLRVAATSALTVKRRVTSHAIAHQREKCLVTIVMARVTCPENAQKVVEEVEEVNFL